jgi:hypothetical protein
MRPKEINIAPVSVDPDGIAEAQTLVGAGSLALDGDLVVGGVFTGDYARRIGILSAGDDSGDTFTITGTNADGKSQTEDVAGSAGAPGTAESVKYFKTITDVSTSGASTGNVSVGTVDEFITNTIPIETSNQDPATISLENFSGTISASVTQTFSRVQYSPIIFFDGPDGLTDETAKAHAVIDNHATGVRLVVGSYTSGATLTMIINQNRQF